MNPLWWTQQSQNLEWIENQNIQISLIGDSSYPLNLIEWPSPPPILTWIGSSQWMKGHHLAVVGSRNMSSESRRWIENYLPPVLGRYPLLLLSGGARGTDQLAHSICLRGGTRTACFLPSGLLNPYPNEIHDWIEAIVEAGGSVVSSFHPRVAMRKHYFHLRNHLISGLSGLVFAIDGRRKSGTMITARAAMDQGKAVAILPHHPIHGHALGGLDLLFDGAHPVRDDMDLEALCRIYVRN